MDTFDTNWILIVIILIGVSMLLSKASVHSERLKSIETLLLAHPDIDQSVLDLSPEVKQKIAEGDINRAIVLHREQRDSSARSAELAVKKYIAQQT